MPFVHITSRVDGRKDDGLLAKIGGSYFPYIVAMDAGGKVVALLDTDKDRNVEEFKNLIKSGAQFAELREKAEKGDTATKLEYFSQALKLGSFTLEEARKFYAGMKDVPAEKKSEIEGRLASMEHRAVLAPLMEERDRAKQKEMFPALGKKLWEMDKAGRIPSDEGDFRDFYALIIFYAEKDKDIPAFERALQQLKEKGGDRMRGFVNQKEPVLQKLKEEKEGPKEEKPAPKEPK